MLESSDAYKQAALHASNSKGRVHPALQVKFWDPPHNRGCCHANHTSSCHQMRVNLVISPESTSTTSAPNMELPCRPRMNRFAASPERARCGLSCSLSDFSRFQTYPFGCVWLCVLESHTLPQEDGCMLVGDGEHSSWSSGDRLSRKQLIWGNVGCKYTPLHCKSPNGPPINLLQHFLVGSGSAQINTGHSAARTLTASSGMLCLSEHEQ